MSMKPTTKPVRTAQEMADEVAIRQQHAAHPIKSRPTGTIARDDFAEIIRLIARLKSQREQQGLTLTETAERIGIDAPALSRLETGKMLNPTLATILCWAEALGIKIGFQLSQR